MKKIPVVAFLILALTPVVWVHADFVEDFRAVWTAPEVVQKIDAGIEQHRKGDAVILVVDKEGSPLRDIQVSAAQKSHAFLFGANLFVLGQLATPELNAGYEQAFTRIFNFASLPFYWGDLEPERGKPRFGKDAPYIWRRPPPDALLAWCKAHNITPKGHPLLWHSINPEWMPAEPDALHAAYTKRFGEIATRYGNDIPIWDVVNESLVCPATYPLFSQDRAYVSWAFEQAHQAFPDDTLLMINEVMHASHKPVDENAYLDQVKALLASGAGIESIGFQFHFFSRDALDKQFLADPAYTPDNLWQVYETFSALGLPLYIAEITIPGSGDNGPATQAEVVEHLYRLWFSVNGMAGITWWNLVDKSAYGNEGQALGGLVDETLQPKPAYQALDRLINQEWKTDYTGKTDANGRVMFRGFAGDYQITATASDGTERVSTLQLAAGKENAMTCVLE